MAAATTTDVLIVGAGPTGLALAGQLTRYGIAFRLIETRDGVTPYSKALGVHARTLEIYEQIGLADAAVAQGQVAGKVRLLEHGKVRGEIDLATVGQGLTRFPYMLILEQSKNERLMYDYLLNHGGEVEWGATLESFSQTAGGVTAHVRTGDGALQTIEAGYLIGCDGPHSLVRHGLGLAFQGSTFERLFFVADVQIEWEYSHDALHICLAPHSAVAFFPMPGHHRYRIVGSFPEGADKEAGEILYAEIEEQIRQQADISLEISHVDWFSVYKVHSRHAERFSSGRCFVAGNSAHIHTPAGGQGMNTGIQDAYNLAWKLAFVLSGRAAASLLESYSQERVENARRLLATTDRMFNIGAGTDWLLNVIRGTILPPLAGYVLRLEPVRRRFFSMISQIGISYRDSALSHHGADAHHPVRAGDRMPYFLTGGRGVFDLLHAPTFHLVCFATTSAADPPPSRNSEDGLPDWVVTLTVPLEPHVKRLFGMDGPFAVLLRPDNHIALISEGTSTVRASSYLLDLSGGH